MREFKDKKSNRWEIDLNIGVVLRVRTASEGAFDLLEPSTDDLAQRLSDDFASFFEVLWLVIKPQAQANGVTNAEQFGELIAADCLLEAQREFFREWADFFHRLQRAEKATLLEKIEKYTAKATALAAAKLAKEMDQIDSAVETRLNEALNKAFGDLRASLALTPEP